MKVIINSQEYYDLRGLSFNPEVDVTCMKLPAGSFSVEIYTTDQITEGSLAELRDDMNNLWANYRITAVDHSDPAIAKITADNGLGLLVSTKLEETGVYWNTASAVLDEIMSPLRSVYGTPPYTMSSALSNDAFLGYMPAQDSRTRLQWVLFHMGAFITTVGVAKPYIASMAESSVTTVHSIPISDTYYKPLRTPKNAYIDKDKVNTIAVTAYHFELAAYDIGEKMAVIDGRQHILTPYKVRLFSSMAAWLLWALGLEQNSMVVDGITIMEDYDSSTTLSRIFPYCFGQAEIKASVINNHAYAPGKWAELHMDADTTKKGLVTSANFSFGVQAKSDIAILETWSSHAEHPMHALTAQYTFPGDGETGSILLDTGNFHFPAELYYSVETFFLSYRPAMTTSKYVFRPVKSDGTGTTLKAFSGLMPTSDTTVTVQYSKALMFVGQVLTVISVSAAESDFRFYHVTDSSFTYSKDIHLQVDGNDLIISDTTSYIKMKTLSGTVVRWWPAEYVTERGGSVKPVDLSIQEGNVGRVFLTVEKLRIPLNGGGYSEWIVWEQQINENG